MEPIKGYVFNSVYLSFCNKMLKSKVSNAFDRSKYITRGVYPLSRSKVIRSTTSKIACSVEKITIILKIREKLIKNNLFNYFRHREQERNGPVVFNTMNIIFLINWNYFGYFTFVLGNIPVLKD